MKHAYVLSEKLSTREGLLNTLFTTMFGNAEVVSNAQVVENAQMAGNAQMVGNAQTDGNAQVVGNAHPTGRVPSSRRPLQPLRAVHEWRCRSGPAVTNTPKQTALEAPTTARFSASSTTREATSSTPVT